jgi:hypothetical protein
MRGRVDFESKIRKEERFSSYDKPGDKPIDEKLFESNRENKHEKRKLN